MADTWLYSVLTGDTGVGGLNTLATGGIHNTQASDAAARPYVIYAFVGGVHENGGKGVRIGSHLDYDVSAYTEGNSFALADTMAERIQTLLHRVQPVAVAGGTIAPQTVAPLGQLPNPLGGVRINKRGHTTRLFVQKTA